MLRTYKAILWSLGLIFIFLLIYESNESNTSLVFGRETPTYRDIKRYVNKSYDPAAPSIPCDSSCHTQPKYRREETHQTEACVICHMSAEQLAKQTTAKSSPISQHKRQLNGYLVENQKAARLRLKGKPMILPKIDLMVPEGMVYIPKGEFIMGTNIRWEDEAPEHVIYLHEYFIDQDEITNADYKKFVDASGYLPPRHWKQGSHPEELASHPVTYVSWYDAVEYCRWAGKRLPDEREWEKAARGTDGRQYPWGNAFYEDRSNNPQKESKGTEKVGSYENGKSPYGLYDMSGNVWEWVDAFYKPHPGNQISSEEYGEKYKVAKGGSWYNCLFYNCGISAPSYNRSFLVPITKNSTTGFRCLKDVTSSQ